MSIVCHVLVHDSPKPFDRVQVRAVRRQLDKMDTTIWPCDKFSNIQPFVIGGIIPDDMNKAAMAAPPNIIRHSVTQVMVVLTSICSSILPCFIVVYCIMLSTYF